MKDESYFIESADRYIDGEMTAEERVQFETLCRDNAEVQKILNEQIQIRSYFSEHADIADLKTKMGSAYNAWKTQDSVNKKGKETANTRVPSSRIIPFKPYLWKVAGVAAAIAFIITFAGVLISHNYNQHKLSSYTILRREIDNIKRSQNSLINDIHRAKSGPINPGQYGGTGFALSANGLIATNAHVIAGADSVYVETSKGEVLKASIVYKDIHSDLAVLKIDDSTFQLPPLPYGLKEKDNAPLGEEVYTLGYPKDEIVYGKGYISSETGYRGDTNSYQVSIPVNPGNSGGPLIDAKGQILGIVTGKQSPSDNIAFAVKSSFLLSMLDSIPDGFNRRALLREKNVFQHLNRVDQIKKLQSYIFLVKVYN
ncbi:MAG: serine protease [Chitinophagaceae bacterium]|nr:MAG: serine protease [Chitinophagaceae bacterium]